MTSDAQSDDTTERLPMFRIKALTPERQMQVGGTFKTIEKNEEAAVARIKDKTPFEVFVTTAEGGSTWVSVWADDAEQARERAVEKERHYRNAENVDEVEVPEDVEYRTEELHV